MSESGQLEDSQKSVGREAVRDENQKQVFNESQQPENNELENPPAKHFLPAKLFKYFYILFCIVYRDYGWEEALSSTDNLHTW